MRFTPLLAVAAFVGVTVAKDPTYHCGGQELCSTMQVKFCDVTVNEKLERNDDENYGSPE